MMTVGIGAIALMWGDASPMRAIEIPVAVTPFTNWHFVRGRRNARRFYPRLGSAAAVI